MKNEKAADKLPFRQRLKDFLLDPGFLFNTGFMATFATVVPVVGWLPIGFMAANWIAGNGLLAYKKKLLPESWRNAIDKHIGNNAIGRFMNRNNATLATNGSFLLATGLAVSGLALAGLAPHLGTTLAQPLLKTLGSLVSNPAFLTSVPALGYGISNLKKADEMDGVTSPLMRALPALGKVNSEVTIAAAGLCMCLLTGGASLAVVPPLIYALRLGEKSATDPDNSVYKFTRWLATSPYVPLPAGLKKNLLREHPLTISRRMDFGTLAFSVGVGTVSFIARSAAAGTPLFEASDFATLANLSHTGGAYRLYQFTDAACGDLPKVPADKKTAAAMPNTGQTPLSPSPLPAPTPVISPSPAASRPDFTAAAQEPAVKTPSMPPPPKVDGPATGFQP